MNAPASNPASRPGYRGVVLAMLLLVYTFNFLDRQILGILAHTIGGLAAAFVAHWLYVLVTLI